jgi:hypothetical protein
MKENIIRYKGNNPLIGIPSFNAVIAYPILALTFAEAFWPENGSGWSGLITVLVIMVACWLCIFGTIFLLQNSMNTLASFTLARKESERQWLSHP